MILSRILSDKKKELRQAKKITPFSFLKKEALRAPRNRNGIFLKTLRSQKPLGIIAEIKKKSPSKGVLRKNFDPVKIASAYEAGGAVALSILTDQKYFAGSTEILRRVRAVTDLPILRKDFLLDEYQVYESKVIGADAVLLIAAILPANKLKALARVADKLGLDVLFEIHNERDLRKLRHIPTPIVGINNRDLRSFKVDIRTTERLMSKVAKHSLIVSESGIQTAKDLVYLKKLGVNAVLVGEGLMRKPDLEQALRRWLGAL